MPDVIYVIYDIYNTYYMYGDLTYTICSNLNIGVKRSVRTSGMQPTMMDALELWRNWPTTSGRKKYCRPGSR